MYRADVAKWIEAVTCEQSYKNCTVLVGTAGKFHTGYKTGVL